MKKITFSIFILSVIFGLFLCLNTAFAWDAIPAKSTWTVTTSSQRGTCIGNIKDGSTSTYWHSNYTNDGGTITWHEAPPYTIEVTLPSNTTVSGIDITPRQDSYNGNITGASVYASDSASGDDYVLVKENATFANSYAVKEVNFPNNLSVRRIKVVITAATNNYGTMAEFDFLEPVDSLGASTCTEYGTYTSLVAAGITYTESTWTATVNSQMGTSINNILDNNTSTYWHSHYDVQGNTVVGHDNPPYTIDVTLPATTAASGITFTPRQDSLNGCILKASIYAAASSTDDYTLIAEDRVFVSGTGVKTINFAGNILVGKVRLVITESNSNYGTMAEFDLIAPNSEKSFVGYDDYSDFYSRIRLYEIDNSNFAATYTGSVWSGHIAQYVFDNAAGTFWQTDPGNDPYELIVDMRQNYNVRGFSYLPRQTTDIHGAWTQVNVYYSTDGTNYTSLETGLTFAADLSEKEVELDSPVTARYFKFEIVSGNADRASCAELDLYQSKADYDAYMLAYNQTFAMSIGSDQMSATKNGTTSTVTLDGAPFVENDLTFVPAISFFNAIDATPTWDGTTETLSFTQSYNDYVFQNRDNLVYRNNQLYGNVKFTFIATPRIVDNVLYVPLRYIAKQMGYDAQWNSTDSTITLTREPINYYDTVTWVDPGTNSSGLTYTVTYDANEGTCQTAYDQVNEGSSVTLPEATRTGYTFTGWYVPNSAVTLAGTNGASYTPTGNVTLYAGWEDDYTLADAKSAKVSEITAYKTESNYEAADWNTIEAVITNYTTSINASYNETQLTNLVAEAKAEMDEVTTKAEKASDVDALILQIGTPVTVNSASAIGAARTAYNALETATKAYVTNYSVLTAAESAFDKIAFNYNYSTDTSYAGTTDATFTLDTGKTISSVTYNGTTVVQGDGVTRWESSWPYCQQNYTYDTATGAFVLSRKFVRSLGIDSASYDVVVNFSDSTSQTVRIYTHRTWRTITSVTSSGYQSDEVVPTVNVWKVSVNSAVGTTTIFSAVDGVSSTRYHSYYTAVGSTITYRDKIPMSYDFDFGSQITIGGIRHTLRTDSQSGMLKGASFYSSNDGVTWTLIKSATYTLDSSPAGDVYTTQFDSNVTCRYFRVLATDTVNGYFTIGEMHILAPIN